MARYRWLPGLGSMLLLVGCASSTSTPSILCLADCAISEGIREDPPAPPGASGTAGRSCRSYIRDVKRYSST